MATAYDHHPTNLRLLATHKQEANPDAIDWEHLTELVDTLALLPAGIPVHITPAHTDPEPCGGTGCPDGDECDAEYVITHRTPGGRFTYPTPVCRGCLLPEINHLRAQTLGVDTDSIAVRLYAPRKTQP